ncbi:MAG TPA: hypothetical protein VFI17_03590 [Solirubrobacterales bacterium]|nr:hypothetical protein [Solirubrobacterales bacterium]
MIAGRQGPVAERIPTTEGRAVLVRPALHGEGVHLAIVGKRGGLVEGVGIGLDQVANFVLAVDGISEIAWARHTEQLRRSRRERERRHAAALAANPWLKKRDRREVVVNG